MAQSYGEVYLAAGGGTVASGAHMLFDTNGPLVNVTHSTSANTDRIGVVDAGEYEVRWQLLAAAAQSQQWGLAVNGGAVLANSVMGCVSATTNAPQISGALILSMSAGDYISLINAAGTTTTLAATSVGGSGTDIIARLSIVLIGSAGGAGFPLAVPIAQGSLTGSGSVGTTVNFLTVNNTSGADCVCSLPSAANAFGIGGWVDIKRVSTDQYAVSVVPAGSDVLFDGPIANIPWGEDVCLIAANGGIWYRFIRPAPSQGKRLSKGVPI